MAEVSIGDLRWSVMIAGRVQSATDDGGLQDSLVDVQSVRADIQPTGAMTFYAGVQVDSPVTHRVTMRWLDWVDTTHVIRRETRRQDGTVRTELFRVRRVKEIKGRKRFIECECELEERE